MPTGAERFHAIIRGDQRGLLATLARIGLWWLRIPYACAMSIRNWKYDRASAAISRPAVPVVSIGNLTLGGTGKTPCVEYVASYYREHDVAVAILSRGYGVESGPNDEALLLEENLPDVPHLQGRDRMTLAQTAIEELESEMILLDDGFQHRRLFRDLDIVLCDATQPIQNEYHFPRGLLREPVSGLKRASFVLFTRCDQASTESLAQQKTWLQERYPNLRTASTIHKPIVLIGMGQSLPVDAIAGKSVAAFCGIANPEAFRQTLLSLGASIVAFRTFPDHHNFTREDIEVLNSWAAETTPDCIVLTTQKDWVKVRIAYLGDRPLYAMRIGLSFTENEAEFQQLLTSVIRPSFPESADAEDEE